MRSLNTLVPAVISAVSQSGLLPKNTALMPEYTSSAIAVPLKNPAVAVGIAEVTPFEDIIGNFEGADSDGGTYAARSARIVMRFSIFLPARPGYEADCDFPAVIAGILFGNSSPFTFSSCKISEMSYDKTTVSLKRVMIAEMQALLSIEG